jgi:uncharacterized membrane protein
MIPQALYIITSLFSLVMFYLIFRRKRSTRIGYILLLLLFNAGLIPSMMYLHQNPEMTPFIPLILDLIIIILIIRRIFTKENPDQETLNAWHDDPKNWVLGFLYFNSKDNRIFPPKRIEGMGWTVNFANPYSILILILIIILIIAIGTIGSKLKG